MRVGVIGYGYWGPNIVRNCQRARRTAELVAVCDKSPAALQRAQRLYPGVQAHHGLQRHPASPDVDAVAVVTPVWTHYELAKAALENGKHVFVEKPFTSTPQQAEELIELAERKNLKIMVDHTFLFSGAVRKIKRDRRQRARSGRSITSTRPASTSGCSSTMSASCGIWRRTTCRSWTTSSARSRKRVVATGGNHLNGLADMAFITDLLPAAT